MASDQTRRLDKIERALEPAGSDGAVVCIPDTPEARETYGIDPAATFVPPFWWTLSKQNS